MSTFKMFSKTQIKMSRDASPGCTQHLCSEKQRCHLKYYQRYKLTRGNKQLTIQHNLPLNNSSFIHIPLCPPHLASDWSWQIYFQSYLSCPAVAALTPNRTLLLAFTNLVWFAKIRMSRFCYHLITRHFMSFNSGEDYYWHFLLLPFISAIINLKW